MPSLVFQIFKVVRAAVMFTFCFNLLLHILGSHSFFSVAWWLYMAFYPKLPQSSRCLLVLPSTSLCMTQCLGSKFSCYFDNCLIYNFFLIKTLSKGQIWSYRCAHTSGVKWIHWFLKKKTWSWGGKVVYWGIGDKL